jgi:hypothetical protein
MSSAVELAAHACFAEARRHRLCCADEWHPGEVRLKINRARPKLNPKGASQARERDFVRATTPDSLLFGAEGMQTRF